MSWRRELSRQPRRVVIAGAVVVALVGAGAVWVVAGRGDDLGDHLGGRDGWLRTDNEPAAVAVSGAAGGPVRSVLGEEDGDPFLISTHRNAPDVGEVASLDGSEGAGARPMTAAAEGSGAGWLVVGGGGEDAPLTVWSSSDAETPDGDGDVPPVPGVTLPDSDFGTSTRTVAAAMAGDDQVVVAADHGASQIVVWGRQGDGRWERSTIDPIESARSTPPPDRSVIDGVRVATDGDRFVVAAIAGDPAILSIWASGPVSDDGSVSWQRTAEELDGEPACHLAALHASASGVLLGWSPLGPDGCMDQEEVRFTMLGASDEVGSLPTLDPQVSGAIVRDAVSLRDGTTVAVGSREDPPYSATGDDERAPIMWLSSGGGDWEQVDNTPLSEQLDQEATVVSVDEGWSPELGDQTASADALEQLLVVTRPYDPLATPDGMALWTWERDDDG